MSNDNNQEESIISVRTPWGSLAKSEGIQSSLDSLKNDLALLNKRIRELDKDKSSSNSSNSNVGTLTKSITDFEKRLNQVETKMNDLEAKFEKFSTKTLQILEQLRKDTF